MAGRYAVLLDGGFVTKRLERLARRERGTSGDGSTLEGGFPTAEVVLAYVRRLSVHDRLATKELYRIYFYDAPPLEGVEKNPISKKPYNFGTHSTNALNKRLQDSLAHSPDVAVRRGEAVFRGWKVRRETIAEFQKATRPLLETDLAPDIEQKSVDLRIGLDVALLALRQVVDVVVLVTGDSDLVPAMKLARREGIKVYLDPMGNRVRPSLTEHADFVFS